MERRDYRLFTSRWKSPVMLKSRKPEDAFPVMERDSLSKLNQDLLPHDGKTGVWKRSCACDPKSVETRRNDMGMHGFQWNWVTTVYCDC